MGLPSISEPISFPDVFWATGDAVFQKSLPKDWSRESVKVQMMHQMIEIRGNLNYHLLTHRRLVLPDTSLLLNFPLMVLFRQRPAYQDFLRQGIIIPAMRENVESFRELVPILRKGKNWIESSQIDMDENAMFLDSLRPTIAETVTSLNREIMDQVGTERLLQLQFWKYAGLGAIGEQLVKFVPIEMRNNNQKHIRQTEFWQFAAKLDTQRKFLQAKNIRAYLSIISFGIMSRNLGIPPCLPAAYSQEIDHVYGTSSPFRGRRNTIVTEHPKLEETIDDIRQHFYGKVFYLEPDMIWTIRESEPYKHFLVELEAADESSEHTENENLFLAWQEYLRTFPTIVGLAITGSEDQWKGLRLKVRWMGPVGKLSVPITVGLLLSYLHCPQPWPALSSLLSTAATFFLIRRAESQISRLQNDAQVRYEEAIPQLRRDGGRLISELYGPVAKDYWQLSE